MKSYTENYENLLYLESVDEIIDLVIRNDEALAEPARFADTIFGDLEAALLEQAQTYLEEGEFYSEIVSSLDDEIVSVDIETISIDNKSLLDVSDEGAEYEVTFNITAIAKYSISDYERSPWDPEDKRYMFVLRNELVQKHLEQYSAYVNIGFTDAIRVNAEILELDFENVSFELSEHGSELIRYTELDVNGE